ncbi:MAG: DUF2237 family protein [Halothiobacillus sp.]|nr:DUF2237 family protein [Halothiobacillus sp.]
MQYLYIYYTKVDSLASIDGHLEKPSWAYASYALRRNRTAGLRQLNAKLTKSAFNRFFEVPSNKSFEQNVYGQPLAACSKALGAGADRSGFCRLSIADLGVHGVCAQMTEEFLTYTLGNL